MSWHSPCFSRSKCMTMFSNNFKIALRTLKKNKVYTIINLLGLTVGIAAALLIFRLVSYELSFNKNFENYDNIARVITERMDNRDEDRFSVCAPIPAMDALEENIASFEKIARVKEVWGNITIPNPNGGPPLKKFGMEDAQTAFFTVDDFIEIFDFQALGGEINGALDEPGGIIFTRSMAEKCFDNWENAIGETVLMDNLIPLTVRAVLENLPSNCDFNFPFLISYQTLKDNASLFFYDERWGSCSSNDQVYVALPEGTDFATVNALLEEVGAEQYTDQATGQRERKHVLQPSRIYITMRWYTILVRTVPPCQDYDYWV